MLSEDEIIDYMERYANNANNIHEVREVTSFCALLMVSNVLKAVLNNDKIWLDTDLAIWGEKQ